LKSLKESKTSLHFLESLAIYASLSQVLQMWWWAMGPTAEAQSTGVQSWDDKESTNVTQSLERDREDVLHRTQESQEKFNQELERAITTWKRAMNHEVAKTKATKRIPQHIASHQRRLWPTLSTRSLRACILLPKDCRAVEWKQVIWRAQQLQGRTPILWWQPKWLIFYRSVHAIEK
jgi:hypothetical protein